MKNLDFLAGAAVLIVAARGAAQDRQTDAGARTPAGAAEAEQEPTASTQGSSATANSEPPAAPGLDPRREGTAVASLTGEFGVLDPSLGSRDHITALGYQFQMITRRSAWPAMIGLGGGVLTFDSASGPGPFVATTAPHGSFYTGTTTQVTSVELRHAELIVRVEPWWGVVRPFLEGWFGLAVLWHGDHLEDGEGHTLVDHDKQRSAAALYGGALGLDWRLFSTGSNSFGTTDLVLTTGVRRLYTTPMERPSYLANADAELVTREKHERLGMWVPFVAIAVAFDTRPAARAATPLP